MKTLKIVALFGILLSALAPKSDALLVYLATKGMINPDHDLNARDIISLRLTNEENHILYAKITNASPVAKFDIPANWKITSFQFSDDGVNYHEVDCENANHLKNIQNDDVIEFNIGYYVNEQNIPFAWANFPKTSFALN